jgi:hypothetical protein
MRRQQHGSPSFRRSLRPTTKDMHGRMYSFVMNDRPIEPGAKMGTFGGMH